MTKLLVDNGADSERTYAAYEARQARAAEFFNTLMGIAEELQ